jgi:hypothetical protein
MKKHLLLGLALGIGLTAAAQQRPIYPSAKKVSKPNNSMLESLTLPSAFQNAKNTNPTVTPASVVGVTDIGGAGNLYGMAFGAKTQLWADPNLNSVIMVHRQSTVQTHGSLAFDLSKDNGATWTTNTQIYTSNGTNAAPNANARYPQAFIYNPTGNTVPDSAYIAYYAPTLAGVNDTWGGHAHGVKQLRSTAVPTQMEDLANDYLIPDGGMMTHLGTIFVTDNKSTAYTGTPVDYSDTMIISKGTWNAITKDFDYTRTKLYVPLSVKAATSANSRAYAGSSIAFAPNGLTGYLAMLGHATSYSTIDSSYYPVVYKTTDGGLTWNGPINVDISSIQLVQDSLVGNVLYTTAFEIDMQVDMNGNPHITCGIGAGTGDWSIGTGPGTWGIFDIYSPDGGTTWNAALLRKPHTFRGCFGDCPSGANRLEEDSRPQVSSNWAGSKLYFVHFDTDTVTFGGTENIYPDAWVSMLDVATMAWSGPYNMTTGVSSADGEMTFGVVSPYTLVQNGDGADVIPIAFQRETVPGDVVSPSQIKYLNGVTMPTGINEVKGNNLFTVGQNYPNPFDNTTEVTVQVKQSTELTLEVYNTLGQSVSTKKLNLTAGEHKLTIDGSKLTSGIYFYSIKAGEFQVTRKMTVSK